MMMDAALRLMNEAEGRFQAASVPDRADMLRELTQLFCQISARLTAEARDVFDSLFVSLTPNCDERSRATLADRLAASPHAPRRLIRLLAFDEAIAVARPVIRLSPLLLDDDLLALATARTGEHLLAMAERPALSARVTDVLVTRADGRLALALLVNPGVAFSADGRKRLAPLAADDADLHDAMAARPDFVGLIELDTALPAEVAPSNLPPHILQRRREIDDLLTRGRIDDALERIATALNAPFAPVARAFAVDADGGFLAYLKACDLAWETAERFLTARAKADDTSPRLQRASRDFNALTTGEAKRVVQLLVAHSRGSRR
jgi:uncharacterized protein (DUF2336 family)